MQEKMSVVVEVRFKKDEDVIDDFIELSDLARANNNKIVFRAERNYESTAFTF